MALSVPRLLPTKTYPFSDLRHMFAAAGVQPGVMATGATTEFKVTQDTGSNMNVKVLQGDSGAWVTGLDTTRQGAYHVYNDAAVTLAVPAAHATLPRIDQLVLRVYDSNVIGGGTDAGAFEVIQGTATAGAQATNAAGANYRAGAANLTTIAAPKTLIRLADLPVPAAATAITNANIVDRRSWARGAFQRLVRTAGNLVSASTSQIATDTTNLQARIECTGVPLRLTLTGIAQNSSAGALVGLNFWQDGNGPDSIGLNSPFLVVAGTAGAGYGFTFSYTFVPTAGSHLFVPAWGMSAGTGTLLAGAGQPLTFTIEELLVPNTNNGTT